MIALKVDKLRLMPDSWVEEMIEDIPEELKLSLRESMFERTRQALDRLGEDQSAESEEEDEEEAEYRLRLRRLKASQKLAPRLGEVFIQLPKPKRLGYQRREDHQSLSTSKRRWAAPSQAHSQSTYQPTYSRRQFHLVECATGQSQATTLYNTKPSGTSKLPRRFRRQIVRYVPH